MLVKDVMSKDLTLCTPQETVVSVAKLMKVADVSAIPVVQDGSRRLVGIITDRDIALRVVAEGRDPNVSSVGSVMSRDIVSTSPEEALERSARLMQARRVRRLPVLDEKGTIVGIVAEADVAPEMKAA